ncbi:hypothetical protein [Pseudonocardia sp. TMWB2A]|uniref:hypothetical protein n=1 Tax=Pseudonocardia sp. TMWB2A TaxID=687430 RepID=UPI00307CF4F4
MDEEFTLMLFTGMFLGVVMTLLIQAYGRRKVKKALGSAMPAVPQAEAEERRVALLASENERQQGQIGRLEERNRCWSASRPIVPKGWRTRLKPCADRIK